MDETLVAAKLQGNVPANFEETFRFQLNGLTVSVRLRPYL